MKTIPANPGFNLILFHLSGGGNVSLGGCESHPILAWERDGGDMRPLTSEGYLDTVTLFNMDVLDTAIQYPDGRVRIENHRTCPDLASAVEEVNILLHRRREAYAKRKRERKHIVC